jgi:phage regulator Rha-like protein
MPGWGDAIRDANDKEKNDAIREQLEEWQNQRARGSDRGKYSNRQGDYGINLK